MAKLVQNTTARRETVSTAAVVIVPPEQARRTIKLVAPGSPQMFFMIDQTPDDVADCRAYYWAPLPAGFPFTIELRAGQLISAISDTAGLAPISVITEYPDD